MVQVQLASLIITYKGYSLVAEQRSSKPHARVRFLLPLFIHRRTNVVLVLNTVSCRSISFLHKNRPQKYIKAKVLTKAQKAFLRSPVYLSRRFTRHLSRTSATARARRGKTSLRSQRRLSIQVLTRLSRALIPSLSIDPYLATRLFPKSQAPAQFRTPRGFLFSLLASRRKTSMVSRIVAAILKEQPVSHLPRRRRRKARKLVPRYVQTRTAPITKTARSKRSRSPKTLAAKLNSRPSRPRKVRRKPTKPARLLRSRLSLRTPRASRVAGSYRRRRPRLVRSAKQLGLALRNRMYRFRKVATEASPIRPKALDVRAPARKSTLKKVATPTPARGRTRLSRR